MERGDLLRTTSDLFIRKDGLCFPPDQLFHPGISVNVTARKALFDGADELPSGSYCSFVEDANDPVYVVVMRDMVGRPLLMPVDYVEIVCHISDADI